MKTQRSACKWHASGTATTMCCCDANSLLIGLDSDNAWAAAESSSALVLGGRVSNNCKWKQLQVRGNRRRQLSQQTVKPTKIYRTREDENPDAPSELDTQVPLAAAMHEINRQQNKLLSASRSLAREQLGQLRQGRLPKTGRPLQSETTTPV